MGKENVIGRIGIGISESARWLVKGRTKKQEGDVMRIIKDPSCITDQDIENYQINNTKILSFLFLAINVDKTIKMIEMQMNLTRKDIETGIVRAAYSKAEKWKLKPSA